MDNNSKTKPWSLKEKIALTMKDHNLILASILIPLSLVFDFACRVNFFIDQLFGNKEKNHQKNVQDVQRQVKEWMKTDQSVPMCTSKPAWKSVSLQPLSYKSKLYKISIDMKSIIQLDEKNMKVRVEPAVSIGDLNDFLIKKGWMLPIVPELDELTIGGLVMGGGIETTSKRYGLFHYICLGYELVLADATVIWCDENNHSELYHNIPFSYGTFGFLTAIEMKIVQFKKYVKLTYHPTMNVDSAIKLIGDGVNDPEVDTCEGIVFSKNTAVIMNGKFVDSLEAGVEYNPIGRWYKPWFFSHVATLLEKYPSLPSGTHTEIIPSMDYFHRHNKPIFWLLDDHISCGNHPIFRYLLGWTLPIRFQLLKWLRNNILGMELDKNLVVQDFAFRLHQVKGFLEIIDQDMHIYPIWLCPLISKEDVDLFDGTQIKEGEVVVDIGIYGTCALENFDPLAAQKKLETVCLEENGALAFYAKTLLTKEEFDQITFHNSRNYDRLRKQYNCEKAFPHVYYKISCQGRE